MLDVLFSNSNDNYYSVSIINVCRYLVETYEDDFISATGNYWLTFSSQISAVETTSIMSDIVKISKLRIFLRILRNKLGEKMFELEHLMKDLSGDVILPEYGEYKYYHEARSKPEVILF